MRRVTSSSTFCGGCSPGGRSSLRVAWPAFTLRLGFPSSDETFEILPDGHRGRHNDRQVARPAISRSPPPSQAVQRPASDAGGCRDWMRWSIGACQAPERRSPLTISLQQDAERPEICVRIDPPDSSLSRQIGDAAKVVRVTFRLNDNALAIRNRGP